MFGILNENYNKKDIFITKNKMCYIGITKLINKFGCGL